MSVPRFFTLIALFGAVGSATAGPSVGVVYAFVGVVAGGESAESSDLLGGYCITVIRENVHVVATFAPSGPADALDVAVGFTPRWARTTLTTESPAAVLVGTAPTGCMPWIVVFGRVVAAQAAFGVAEPCQAAGCPPTALSGGLA